MLLNNVGSVLLKKPTLNNLSKIIKQTKSHCKYIGCLWNLSGQSNHKRYGMRTAGDPPVVVPGPSLVVLGCCWCGPNLNHSCFLCISCQVCILIASVQLSSLDQSFKNTLRSYVEPQLLRVHFCENTEHFSQEGGRSPN